MAQAIPIAVLLQIRSEIARQTSKLAVPNGSAPARAMGISSKPSQAAGAPIRFRRSQKLASPEQMHRIEKFLADLHELRFGKLGVHPDSEAYRHAERGLMERLWQMDASASGPEPLGRIVWWRVDDGEAFYFVKFVRGEVCGLVHIPIAKAYHSDIVCDGLALRQAVERRLREQTTINSHRRFLNLMPGKKVEPNGVTK